MGRPRKIHNPSEWLTAQLAEARGERERDRQEKERLRAEAAERTRERAAVFLTRKAAKQARIVKWLQSWDMRDKCIETGPEPGDGVRLRKRKEALQALYDQRKLAQMTRDTQLYRELVQPIAEEERIIRMARVGAGNIAARRAEDEAEIARARRERLAQS